MNSKMLYNAENHPGEVRSHQHTSFQIYEGYKSSSESGSEDLW